MDINSIYRPLFKYDVSHIKHLLNNMDQSLWDANEIRQRSSVRQQETKSIVYVWSGHNDDLFENVEILIPNSDDELTKEVWKMAKQIQDTYGENTRIVKLLLSNLPAGGKIGLHADIKNLCLVHRNHLVISTNEEAIFSINDIQHNFTEGETLEINNQKLHTVTNKGNVDRIHLICDILEDATIENIDKYTVHTKPWW